MSKAVVPGGATVTVAGDTLVFKGLWNADTNTPTLVSSVGTSGDYYIVSVAGSTNLDGETDWNVGDALLFASGVWNKLDNTSPVTSVNGLTGAVVLDGTNVAASHTATNYTPATSFVAGHLSGIDTALGASNIWSEAATIITPVTGTELDMGLNSTIKCNNLDSTAGDDLKIRQTEAEFSLLLQSTRHVDIQMDSNNNDPAGSVRFRDGSNAIVSVIVEDGSYTSSVGEMQVVNARIGTDSAAAVKTLQMITGTDMLIDSFDSTNASTMTLKAFGDIRYVADRDNDSGDDLPHKFYSEGATPAGGILDVEIGSAGLKLARGSMDVNSLPIDNADEINAPSALGLVVAATPVGASDTPAVRFDLAAAGGSDNDDPLYQFRDESSADLFEILRDGDIEIADGAQIRSQAADSGITIDTGAVTVTGSTCTIDNTASATLDIQREIVNTDAGLNGRVAIGDDIQLNKTTDTSIVSNRANAAGASGVIFDTVNSLTTGNAKLMKASNAGTEKFHIAKNGGLGVGLSSTAADVNSNGETCILVTDTSVARTVTLDTDDVEAGRVVFVKDASGGASTNNITVATEGAETIDGATTISISVNYGVARLISDGTNWFTL